MDNLYVCLKNNKFSKENFSLIPFRFEDRYKIMKWRNEQIYHLRQNKALTIEDQDRYFLKTIIPSFDIKRPKQILFSFLKKETCIGYGGLVHIDWKKNQLKYHF